MGNGGWLSIFLCFSQTQSSGTKCKPSGRNWLVGTGWTNRRIRVRPRLPSHLLTRCAGTLQKHQWLTHSLPQASDHHCCLVLHRMPSWWLTLCLCCESHPRLNRSADTKEDSQQPSFSQNDCATRFPPHQVSQVYLWLFGCKKTAPVCGAFHQMSGARWQAMINPGRLRLHGCLSVLICSSDPLPWDQIISNPTVIFPLLRCYITVMTYEPDDWRVMEHLFTRSQHILLHLFSEKRII